MPSRLALLAITCTMALPMAHAEPYPDKPIRLVVPFSPGGGTDQVARLLSRKMAETAGWTLVVDNKPGASGTIGVAEAAHSKPDGYTLVIGQTDNVSIAPSLLKVSFDTTRDFTPIALLATAALVFVVADDSPYRSMADVVADARNRPGAIRFGSNGTGSTLHLVAGQLQVAAGFDMNHVPYKGTTPALQDLIGGHLDLSGGSIASVRTLLESRKLRALAVSGDRRVSALPDVPTLREEGFDRIAGLGWYGLLGPRGLPKEIAEKINIEINRTLRLPEVATTLTSLGLSAAGESTEQFDLFLKKDHANWTHAISATGMKTN